MDIDLNQFREVFLAECAEHVGVIEEGLIELQRGGADTELLNSIFRAAHSMKGAAGTFGWTAIVQLTHAMEDLLDRLRSSRLPVTPQVVGTLLAALDELKELMRQQTAEGDEFGVKLSAEAEQIIGRLRRFTEGGAAEPEEEPGVAATLTPGPKASAQRSFEIQFLPDSGCFDRNVDPLALLSALAAYGAVENPEMIVDRLPAIEELDPRKCYLGWRFHFETELTTAEVGQLVAPAGDQTKLALVSGPPDPVEIRGAAEAKPAAAQVAAVVVAAEPQQAAPQRAGRNTPARDTQSIRVASTKVDQLIDLAGELMIAYSMANEVLAHFDADSLPRLRAAMASMERGTRDLQERVMSVRMTPAGALFQRFPRLIYDVASQTGKKINLLISGEDTELDKVIADQLADPLTHLVRNSADHGIESPEERLAAGKPETGTVNLRAYHQGGKVVIEISDDGKGLNVARIRAKAVERGLIAADADLPESEIQQLIFAPGFSTKDQVSDLSGRGVGMDVVKRNVEALSGSIRLDSELGKGMTVRLFLPLTLAIVDGMLLKVADQHFALPIVSIVESMRPKASQLITLPGGGTAVMLRQESLPLIELSRVYGIEGAEHRPERGLVVIVENGFQKLALLVDDIVGQQQFVIKSVERNFRRVDGTMGATILGDGKVALIVDVSQLKQMAAA